MVTVDVDRYLARIAYDGERTPGVENLHALQLAHLLAVPFENLDVHARTGVHVERAWSLPKIVDRRRGGWCFECNGAFSALLEALGYDVTLHAAQVDQDGRLGPPLDHLALVVRVGGRRWLVDVGFGDAPLAPLDIDDPEPHDVAPRPARVALGDGGAWVELFDRRDGAWTRLHRLDLAPRELAEFAPRSHELQTTPGLMWTERRFATKPLADGGRVFLFGDRLRLRSPDGAVTETPVAEADWDVALDRYVGMRR
jgi:N-hydroxyarylamine O-acetyltransferase